MESWLLDNFIGEFYRLGLGEYIDLTDMKSTIKKIMLLKEYALEYRINALRESLKVYGLNDEEIDELINSIVLNQLEEKRELNYDNLQDTATAYAYLKGIEEEDVKLSFDDEKMLEYSDEVYSRNIEDEYAVIFMNYFNALDENSKNIIKKRLNGTSDELSIEYIAVVNKLVQNIFEVDESLAELVRIRMLKDKEKVLVKK